MKAGAADVASAHRSRKNSSGKTRPPSCRGRIRLIAGASSAAAGGVSTLPGSSASWAARFLQEFTGLLFKGSVSSAASGSGLDFFLFGLHASFSTVQDDRFCGRLFSFPRGGFCFVFVSLSVDLAFALAAGMASSAAARFKQGEAGARKAAITSQQ